jgi:PAS domain S-box-containing protein
MVDSNQLSIPAPADRGRATDSDSLHVFLSESIPQLVWSANVDGAFDYFNQRWCDYTGLTLEQSRGRGWESVLHPQDLATSSEVLSDAFRTGDSFETQARLKRASDDSYRWHLARAVAQRDERGLIVKWIGTFTDIEDQKTAEASLRHTQAELERVANRRTEELQQANLFLKEQVLERERAEGEQLKQAKIFASILDDMGDAVIVVDRDERFLVFNPAAERMFGHGATAAAESSTHRVFLSDQATPFPPEKLPLKLATRGEQIDDLEMFVRHSKAPRGIWTRVSARPLKDGDGELAGGIIVCRDITDGKKEDEFRIGQGRILEMIASGVPLEEVLTQLMLLIEAQSEEMFCSVLLLSDDGEHVRHGAAPSLPPDYVRAVDGAPIGPKNGSCGTAMYRGRQVIVTDVFTDPLWEDYRELARASGLRACWSTPILSGKGKVLGSFAMYYRQPRTPSGKESKLTDVATHIAGIAIDHQRAEQALRRTQAELAHVSRVTTMGELAASIAHEVNQPLGGHRWQCRHLFALAGRR